MAKKQHRRIALGGVKPANELGTLMVQVLGVITEAGPDYDRPLVSYMHPDDARTLAAALIRQADWCDEAKRKSGRDQFGIPTDPTQDPT